MSAVNMHTEGQREVGTIFGGGEERQKRNGRVASSGLEGTDAFLRYRTSALWVFASSTTELV